MVKWGYCLSHYTGVNVYNGGAKNREQTGYSAFSYSERSRTEANFRERSLLNARFAANVREPKRPVSGGSSL